MPLVVESVPGTVRRVGDRGRDELVGPVGVGWAYWSTTVIRSGEYLPVAGVVDLGDGVRVPVGVGPPQVAGGELRGGVQVRV